MLLPGAQCDCRVTADDGQPTVRVSLNWVTIDGEEAGLVYTGSRIWWRLAAWKASSPILVRSNSTRGMGGGVRAATGAASAELHEELARVFSVLLRPLLAMNVLEDIQEAWGPKAARAVRASLRA